MSVAKDGSFGSFGIYWRLIEVDGAMHVHEVIQGEREGHVSGPFDDVNAVRMFMRDRGVAITRFATETREAEDPITSILMGEADEPRRS